MSNRSKLVRLELAVLACASVGFACDAKPVVLARVQPAAQSGAAGEDDVGAAGAAGDTATPPGTSGTGVGVGEPGAGGQSGALGVPPTGGAPAPQDCMLPDWYVFADILVDNDCAVPNDRPEAQQAINDLLRSFPPPPLPTGEAPPACLPLFGVHSWWFTNEQGAPELCPDICKWTIDALERANDRYADCRAMGGTP